MISVVKFSICYKSGGNITGLYMPSKALRLHNAISMSLWEFLVVICEAFLHINRGKLFPSIGSFFSKESFGRDFSSGTTRNKLNLMLINDTSAVSLVFYFISIRSTTIRLLHYVPTAPIYWRRPTLPLAQVFPNKG